MNSNGEQEREEGNVISDKKLELVSKVGGTRKGRELSPP